MTETVFFADCEGNNFLDDIDKMWTIQIAQGVDKEVEVFADQPGYPSIKQGLTLLKKADKIVFHNGLGFDFWAINKLYPGTLRREQIIDSLIISRLMDSTQKRHSLADLGERLGYRKLHFDDFSQFSEEMVTYGKKDVKILQRAWKGDPVRKVRSFGKFYENFREACEIEFGTAYVIEKQRQHGFRFDYENALLLESDLRVEQKELERKLQEIFPPIVTPRYSEKQIDKATGKPKRLKDGFEVFNPGSRPQIAKRLIEKYGWEPLDVTPSGQAKVDESILDDLPYPEAKEIARYMKIGKKLGQLADGDNAFIKHTKMKPDGTYYIHGEINTIGCRTHRMSHFKPNMAQVDSDHRVRSLFIADPDWDLVGVDAEGLELRELAHFLYPYDNGRYVEIVHRGDKKKGTDIHTMNMKAAGLYLRDSAKTMIYAHNYGCFDKKLGIIVVNDAKEAGQPVPEGSLFALGAGLRKKIEVGIVGLGDLIGKCKRTHERRKAMPGHDGRWIPSASDHSALNTLLQGNGSIVMKKALVVFEEELERQQLLDKVGYCANVHDEFQLSVHPDFSEHVAELGKWSITRAGELIEVRCPLVGDAQIGKSWADTH
ncbi:MAG: DNA polymerase I [Gammaproteobacteria bacterium]|nr:DNA polymerase I [Gammaproteobacteria bacterium]